MRIGFEITQILRDQPPNKTKGREFDFYCMEFSQKSGVPNLQHFIYGYRTEEGIVEFLRVTTEKGVLLLAATATPHQVSQ